MVVTGDFMDDILELGGSIQLSGFKSVDSASMVILKKIVGSYTRKFADHSSDFQGVSVTMKPVHETEKSEKYEIHAKLMIAGKPHTSEVTERNLFTAIDGALKKIENSLS
ncbi:hypothetical protein ISS07_04135 [Candidatus Woesearchaeota archaeon]|nr:hypothetical protein [Candidatus Woesearchaeota archaeon]